jgi:hypothetical protein
VSTQTFRQPKPARLIGGFSDGAALFKRRTWDELEIVRTEPALEKRRSSAHAQFPAG